MLTYFLMKTASYWHKLSQYLMIKTALPHLLLGVIATGFSFSQQANLPIQTAVSPVSIIAITEIVQERHVAFQNQSEIRLETDYSAIQPVITQTDGDVSPSKTIRLTPYNGIRAGPVTLA